eukprot:2511118-Rhodomonas_salina.1
MAALRSARSMCTDRRSATRLRVSVRAGPSSAKPLPRFRPEAQHPTLAPRSGAGQKGQAPTLSPFATDSHRGANCVMRLPPKLAKLPAFKELAGWNGMGA